MESISEHMFLSKLAEAMQVLNLNRAEAAVFLYLYLYDPIATQEEISSFLNIQRSAVCTALKNLERMGFVAWKKKGNLKFYFCVLDPKDLVIFLFERHRIIRENVKSMVEERIEQLDAEEKKMLRKRMVMHEKIAKIMKRLKEEIAQVE
jgi:DNA-binding transcriptional regulator GbsR (MarR family)